jgi:hypothetical protein
MLPSFPDTPPGWWQRMHTVEMLTVAHQARANKGNTKQRNL